MNTLSIIPARRSRRLLSVVADLFILFVLLYIIGGFLPVSPPPKSAMAFYSAQDFRNYLTLVSFAFAYTTIAFILVVVPSINATPGQFALGLRLVTFTGNRPSPKQVLWRWLRAMGGIALLVLPGPLIALTIGVTAAFFLNATFTTTEQHLISAGMPIALRYALHSLSFLALAWPLYMLAVHPLVSSISHRGNLPTAFDQFSQTTHVLRAKA